MHVHMHGGEATFLRSPIPQRTQGEAGQPHADPASAVEGQDGADGALLISPSAEQQLELLRLGQRFLVG